MITVPIPLCVLVSERIVRLASSRIHWVVWGTGTPKDRNEVNRREV